MENIYQKSHLVFKCAIPPFSTLGWIIISVLYQTCGTHEVINNIHFGLTKNFYIKVDGMITSGGEEKGA